MALKNTFLLSFMSVTITLIQADEPLLQACAVDDVRCLSQSAEMFFSKTYSGVSEINVKPIDPIIISSVDITADGLDITFHFENSTVTGLKNMKINDFKMDTVKKTVTLKMKVDLTLVTPVEIELTKLHKKFRGDYSSSFTVFETSQYDTSLVDINGAQHFQVGPETNSCEIIEEPVVTLGADLQNIINTDKDAVELKPAWETKKLSIRKTALCAIANRCFETVIHNLRMIANVFPKESFFTNF